MIIVENFLHLYFYHTIINLYIDVRNKVEKLKSRKKTRKEYTKIVNSGLGKQTVIINFIPEGDTYRLAAKSELECYKQIPPRGTDIISTPWRKLRSY